MGLDMRSFDVVPVWVKLPHLNPWFRSAHMLEHIGIMIGSPICLDSVTTSNAKHEFA